MHSRSNHSIRSAQNQARTVSNKGWDITDRWSWLGKVCLLVLLIASIPRASCATDITLVNCPSQFNLTKANQTTVDNVNLI